MSKLSKGQRRIARAAFPFDKITGEDICRAPAGALQISDTGVMKIEKFPYTATGKPQADSRAKMMKGSIVMNPGYGDEESY